MKIRKEIMEFAENMERVMRYHDDEKGNSWKDLDLSELERKLIEEMAEVMTIISKDDIMSYGDELFDVANVCMMLQHECNY